MTKQQFLSTAFPYDIMVSLNKHDAFSIYGIDRGTVSIVTPNDFLCKSIKSIIPIIRPISDLTKECVQSDYNDGKPFVPIVELPKLTAHSIASITENGLWVSNNTDGRYNLTMAFEIAQLLISWHFWPSKPEGEEVVYVSDKFNPYK